MTDKAERMAAIMQRTKLAFMDDSRVKMEQLHRAFDEWERGAADPDRTAGTAYRIAHSMKGLALTLSLPAIDAACERMLGFILQQEGQVWTAEKLESLRLMANRLETAVAEADDAG
ncbi:MAG: Hpt domain-containing protein [Paenibacillaceae bacterium]|nr:Hpt domain-containing protein [Paenibacillaceae bacterium]